MKAELDQQLVTIQSLIFSGIRNLLCMRPQPGRRLF